MQHQTYYLQGKVWEWMAKFKRELSQTVMAKRTLETSDIAALGLITTDFGSPEAVTLTLLRHWLQFFTSLAKSTPGQGCRT